MSKLDYFRSKINEIGLCCSVKHEYHDFYDELLELLLLLIKSNN